MKNRLHLFLLVLLLLFTQKIIANENDKFSGKVVDALTGRPVAWVTISSSSVYTATNAEGEYILSGSYDNDLLTFSHVSYESVVVDPGELSATLALNLKPVVLAEILITPRETIIKELKEVWKKYSKVIEGKKEKHFHESTYYYRQLTARNDIYAEYVECFFSAPTSVAVRTMRLQEGRFAKTDQDSVFSITNYFIYSQISPFTRHAPRSKTEVNTLLFPNFEDYFDLYLEKIISPQKESEIKIFCFMPRRTAAEETACNVSGKLFVRSNDLAIIRAEINLNSLGLNFEKTDVKLTSENHAFILTYRDNLDSYPIVESVQVKTEFIAYIGENVPVRTVVTSALFATDDVFNRKGQKLKQKNRLLNEVAKSKYNEKFWDSHEVVKRTTQEQQVLEDFKKANYFGTVKF